MRHPVLRWTGYGLSGLIVIGLVLTVTAAALSNRPFYGTNYKGLPLGTYSTLTVIGVSGLVGGAWLVRLVLRGLAARAGQRQQ